MAIGLSPSPVNMLSGVACISFLSFLGLYGLMCKLSNKTLPAEGRIPLWQIGRVRWMPGRYLYFDPLVGWTRASREYRRLYPSGRIYYLALGFFIAFLVCALAIFCVRFLPLVAGK